MKVRTISILACGTILLIALGVTLAAARHPVSGSGSAALNPDTGLFEGSADLAVGDEMSEGIPFAVTLLTPLEPDEEGVLHIRATHTFDFGDGDTFTTDDMGVADPADIPGLYILNETLTITSGTGDFEGVSGDLHVHGELDRRELPCASFEVRGAISR